jgi:hypothetical protein
MGAVIGQAIINRARTTLLDDASQPGGGATTWDLAALPTELFEHLKSGLRTIALLKPGSYTLTVAHQLVPGIRQAIPDTAHAFIDARRNLGLTGTTIGPAITSVPMTHLDHDDPNWPLSPASETVLHVMRDARETKAFYVYPPQPNPAAQIELIVAGVPTMAAAANPIPLDDIYEQPLYLFVLAHAYAKNTIRGDMAKWGGYYNQFLQMIGVSAEQQRAYDGAPPDGATR